MESMNISLPEPLKQFVDNQIASGRYSSVSEYVRELIRDDEKRKADERLEALLLEGLQGDEATLTADDWKAIRTEALAQLQADADFMQTLQDSKTRLQAGFLALDPRNGHVMAWVGSRDFAQDPFDHVEQARRQPGSTFKPFVYGAAFENGSLPSDSFVDQALEIPLGNGAFWRPSDGGGPSGQSMTLRQGLMFSKNTITAQVMQQVGPAHVARLARAMGVRQSKLDEVLSLALGTSPVTLKEMVVSYSTLANEGRYMAPVMILQVEDRQGGVLETFAPKAAETALPQAVADTLLDVMRGVIDQGTGVAIRSRYGIRADVAGKTGTTQDNTDGWFILMHSQLVAGAWVGFNDNRITMGDGWGPGARSALPMVGEFFQRALKAKVIDAQARFAAPQSVSSTWGQDNAEQSATTPEQEPAPAAEPASEPASAPEFNRLPPANETTPTPESAPATTPPPAGAAPNQL